MLYAHCLSAWLLGSPCLTARLPFAFFLAAWPPTFGSVAPTASQHCYTQRDLHGSVAVWHPSRAAQLNCHTGDAQELPITTEELQSIPCAAVQQRSLGSSTPYLKAPECCKVEDTFTHTHDTHTHTLHAGGGAGAWLPPHTRNAGIGALGTDDNAKPDPFAQAGGHPGAGFAQVLDLPRY